MSFTAIEHRIKNGIETYAFPSALNPKQRHYIDRVDDGPWELSVVDHDEALSLEEARTLLAEVSELADFMAKLIAAQAGES